MFRNPFKKKTTLNVNVKALTIPESLGYPEEQFSLLVNEMVNFLSEEDRIGTFDSYLKSPFFAKFKLDLSSPENAAVLGYAFCAAVFLQKSLKTQDAVNNLLKDFSTNPDKPAN
jgi:hypothetical protein